MKLFDSNKSPDQTPMLGSRAGISESNRECQFFTRVIGRSATVLGLAADIIGVTLYAISDQNTDPHHKDSPSANEEDELGSVGISVAIMGVALTTLGVSVLAVNKCREKLRQNLYNNQVSEAPSINSSYGSKL